MNFLVHAYCTYPHPDISWGNLYADNFKGSQFKILPHSRALGVQIHRQIDQFTDSHPTINELVVLIRPIAGKMASPFVDVFFDYVLHQFFKTKPSPYNMELLVKFVHDCLLIDPLHEGKMSRMRPYLIRDEWLQAYSSATGILSALGGMTKRMGMKLDVEASLNCLLENYEEVRCFNFITDLKQHVNGLIEEGLTKFTDS